MTFCRLSQLHSVEERAPVERSRNDRTAWMRLRIYSRRDNWSRCALWQHISAEQSKRTKQRTRGHWMPSKLVSRFASVESPTLQTVFAAGLSILSALSTCLPDRRFRLCGTLQKVSASVSPPARGEWS